MKRVVFVVIVLFLSACMSYHPDRFHTVNEMFATETSPPAAMSDAVKKSIFEASYAEVFRAATVSASQSQFNVESDDRKKGQILATRTVMQLPPNGIDPAVPTQHVYFYLISLKELGPKKTEVSIAAKLQGRCITESPACIGCVTLGIMVPFQMARNTRCEKLSEGLWASGDYVIGQDLGQFLTFVRNNLIAANAL